MAPSRRILSFALLAAALTPSAASAAPGSVTLVRAAGSAPSPAEQAFVRARIWRMHGTSAWDPATWVRRSAYALDSATASAHPDWILKDAAGTSLYVGSSLAADFGNAAYRTWWIAQATAQAAGVRGLYVDDVSMERRVTNAWGTAANARDPRTSATMTEANWQRYMADFMVAVRAALPAAEIVHDVLWYKGDTGTDIARELAAADLVAIEKGFNDPAITGSAGTKGYDALAGFVERRQAAGRRVVLDGYADAAAGRLYGLANLLLLDGGRAVLGNDAWTAPSRYWTGYDVALGSPTAARTSWGGVWRRDFQHGIVLVNPPAAATRTLALGAGWADLDGVRQEQVTLTAGSAAVLRKVPVAPPTPTPPPPVSDPIAPVPVAPSTPAPRKPIRRSSSSGATAMIAGAREPGETVTSVSLSRLSVSGRVRGAVGGYVRVTVQRKRGKGWVTVRRVKPNVSKRGRFTGAIARLGAGRYRVVASFEGTGTAQPSRSEYRTRSL